MITRHLLRAAYYIYYDQLCPDKGAELRTTILSIKQIKQQGYCL
jgi:hypothetical protein